MKTSLKCLAGAVALALNCSANAGAIDLFDDGDQVIVDTVQGLAWNGTPAALATGDGVSDASGLGFSSILGGQRDIWINCLTGCTPIGNFPTNILAVTQTLNPNDDPTNGALYYSNNSSTTTEAIVQWDGVSEETDPIVLEYALDDESGPSGFDLTFGGTINVFEFVTLFTDQGWNFRLEAYSGKPSDGDDFKWSTIAFSAIGVGGSPPSQPAPYVGTLAFDAFNACDSTDNTTFSIKCSANGAVDFTRLSAFQLVLNVPVADFTSGNPNRTIALDLELDRIETVPEPATLGLFGAGLLALGAMGRRRKEQSLKA